MLGMIPYLTQTELVEEGGGVNAVYLLGVANPRKYLGQTGRVAADWALHFFTYHSLDLYTYPVPPLRLPLCQSVSL